jgi:hypothetical protein
MSTLERVLFLAAFPLYVLLFIVLTAGFALAVAFVGLREWLR